MNYVRKVAFFFVCFIGLFAWNSAEEDLTKPDPMDVLHVPGNKSVSVITPWPSSAPTPSSGHPGQKQASGHPGQKQDLTDNASQPPHLPNVTSQPAIIPSNHTKESSGSNSKPMLIFRLSAKLADYLKLKKEETLALMRDLYCAK